jgi:S1-C subfamily serine protease
VIYCTASTSFKQRMEPRKAKITLTLTWHVLLAVTLILCIAIGGIAFGGYRLYQKVALTEAAQKELALVQAIENKTKEEEAQNLLSMQAQELAKAQADLTKTRDEAAKTNSQIKTLSATLDAQTKAQKDTIISSGDIAPYVTGVVQVLCVTPTGIVSGSGTLFTFKEVSRAVLTNYHVVKDASKCAVIMTNQSNTQIGMFSVGTSIYTFNSETDEAVLSIETSLSNKNVPIGNYNYSLASLKYCSSPLAVGTPVVIMGFPAYAKRDSTIDISTIGTVNVIYRTSTNGIISGYDTSGIGNANYFVSAKIDSGNSGGIALAKDTNGMCILGLPTWLTVGNYETQGLVQNITNVLPTR